MALWTNRSPPRPPSTYLATYLPTYLPPNTVLITKFTLQRAVTLVLVLELVELLPSKLGLVSIAATAQAGFPEMDLFDPFLKDLLHVVGEEAVLFAQQFGPDDVGLGILGELQRLLQGCEFLGPDEEVFHLVFVRQRNLPQWG